MQKRNLRETHFASAPLSGAAKLDFYLRGENINIDKTPDAFSFDYPGAGVSGGALSKM